MISEENSKFKILNLLQDYFKSCDEKLDFDFIIKLISRIETFKGLITYQADYSDIDENKFDLIQNPDHLSVSKVVAIDFEAYLFLEEKFQLNESLSLVELSQQLDFSNSTHEYSELVFVPIYVEEKLHYLLGQNLEGVDNKVDQKELLSFVAKFISNHLDKEYTQKRFLASEEEYKNIVESASDLIFNADANGNFTYVNKVCVHRTGFTEAELLSKNYLDLIHDNYKKDAGDFYKRQFAGLKNTSYLEFPIVTKKGEVLWLGQNLKAIINGDRVLSYLSVARDITKRKEVEEKLKKREDYLELVSVLQFYLISTNWLSPVMFIQFFDKYITQIDKISFYIKKDLPTKAFTLQLAALISEGEEIAEGELQKFEKDYKEEILDKLRSGKVVRQIKDGFYELHVPLLIKSDFFGIICLQSLSEWGEDDEKMMKYIASALTLYIDRNNIRNELQRSEKLYRSVISSLAEGIVVQNKKGEIIFANESAEQILGMSAEQMMGTKSVDPTWKCIDINNDDFPGEKHPISMSLKTGASYEGVIMGIQQPDLTWSWIQVNSAPIFYVGDDSGIADLAVATFTDITEVKRSQESLIERESSFRSLYNNSPVSILSVSKNGEILAVNDHALKTLQYASEELIGTTINVLFPSGYDNHQHESFIAGYFKNPTVREMSEKLRAIPVKRKDGTHISTEIKLSHVKDKDKKYAIVLIRDISDRKRAEKAVAELKEKETLLKEIHHRVKNNMQIISSLLSLQESQISDPKHLEKYQESKARIKAMALIHEKLYQSKHLSSVDFREYLVSLTSEAVAMYSLDTKINTDLDLDTVYLDIDQAVPCGLIVNELITNSLKYAFKGIDTPEIKMKLRREDAMVSLWISDNGIGLPKGFDINTSKSLGLKLVRTLSQQIQGNIDIETTDFGTTVYIKFKWKEV